MLELLPQNGAKKSEAAFKSGLWTRDANGGVPYEVRDGYFRSFSNGKIALWLLLGGNVNYSNSWSEHLGFQKDKDGKYRASAEFLVAPPELGGESAAALFRKRPVGLRLSTDHAFNLWESGTPELKAEVTNPYDRVQKDVAFSIIGRDFDGKVVLNETKSLTIKPFETASLAFRLPEAEREIYFVEAKVVVPGEKEIFSRTNLAILPPHQFKDLKDSKFALSAYFMIPSEEAVYQLMQRMGVRMLRHGDNRVTSKYGILALDHASVGPNDSPEKVAKRIDGILSRAAERRNPEIEFCNEWNMEKVPFTRTADGAVFDLPEIKTAGMLYCFATPQPLLGIAVEQPKFTAAADPNTAELVPGETVKVKVQVANPGTADAKAGTVSLRALADWKVAPAEFAVPVLKPGELREFTFEATPPETSPNYRPNIVYPLVAEFTGGGERKAVIHQAVGMRFDPTKFDHLLSDNATDSRFPRDFTLKTGAEYVYNFPDELPAGQYFKDPCSNKENGRTGNALTDGLDWWTRRVIFAMSK